MTPPITRAAVLELLEREGPMPASAIAAALGRSKGAIASAIRHARRHQGLLHIAGWKRSTKTSGRMAALWAAGPGRDVRPPAALSARECNASYRRRWAAVLRIKMQARRGSTPDPWLRGLL